MSALSIIILALFAFGVSLLTLFSGFGLGTLLLPAFAFVMPVELAVAATAVVHGANNVFKASLLATSANREVAIRFGVPAILAAFVGAWLLTLLSSQSVLATWHPLGLTAEVTPIKLVLGSLILGFAALELVPGLRKLRAPPKMLPLGGALSGFFGGLSGHQGALRAAFLSPLEMEPKEFAATQAILGLLVDTARLLVYFVGFWFLAEQAELPSVPWATVGIVTISAIAGAYLGIRTLTKVTISGLNLITGILLVVAGATLMLGIA